MPPSRSGLFRRLPSVDEVLRLETVAALGRDSGRQTVAEAVRAVIDDLREKIASGTLDGAGLDDVLADPAALVAERVRRLTAWSLRPVINAGGVIIQTNLGRSPLPVAALDRIVACATGYSNLETDLVRGERGRRDDHAGSMLDRLARRNGLTDVATIVVNNNASAVLLALAELARGGEVIVSRGELVEIGGSFRIPDIMEQSGAHLREVGTTNRTRVADYERAITENTRLLLRVHRSNFEITGFTEQPALSELVELGRRRGLPVMEDLGSGALVDMAAFGIPSEPSLYESLRAGVSVVTCSGDKLLGGPQAGLIAGRPDLIRRLRSHPLFRALRVDKMCYAALEGTLAGYLAERYDEIPLLRMLRLPPEEVARRCGTLAAAVPALRPEVVPTRTMVGGGAAPGKSVPSFALALSPGSCGAQDLARRLRALPVPVVSRIEEDRVLLDLRTVDEEDDAYLARALAGLESDAVIGEGA
ncbi:MAG: L-seryl-tRNA(Sec) selenium transferase [Telmatospirillum sp.]|nr:L-seryl-tRNA(Sec) selenium transferase [Telmatospirillum sp.]